MMIDPIAKTTSVQIAVGNPFKSAWVSANAGTGKTYVLVRRVIRQLLAGARPASIVCITFTKAGAAEMAERLMGMLGEWALMPNAELAKAIGEVTGEEPLPENLSEARRLFARALESPGGLKVQTIHSFCTSILGRFPVEAGVPLGFRGIEDGAARKLLSEALHLLARNADDPGHALHKDFRVISSVLQGETDEEGVQQVTLEGALLDYTHRTQMLRELPEDGNVARAAIQAACAAPEKSSQQIMEECWKGFDDAFAREVIAAFEGEKANGPGGRFRDGLIAAIAAGPSLAFVENSAIFNQDGQTRKSGASAQQKRRVENFDARWEAMCQYFVTYRDDLWCRTIFEENAHFYRIAKGALYLYEELKKNELVLDYDDLIDRTLQLLSTTNNAWVQYKLDEGIDHVLLDEAQDTSGVQWELFGRLVAEIASQDAEAAGQHRPRSLFVVGDPKQSIYAFQGADAKLFNERRSQYKDQLQSRIEDEQLSLSFRTSQAVLDVVDAIFDNDQFRTIAGTYERHASFKPERAGAVELWPHFSDPDTTKIDQWTRPIDAVSNDSIDKRAPLELAKDIKRRIEGGVRLASRKGRKADYSDIMVLFQRRGVRFHETIRALSEMGIPCAGTDRIALQQDTAVRDLLALLRFTASRDDSLSLAVLLKSPLFGWTDDDLMRLCIDRQRNLLWAELQFQADAGDALCRRAYDELLRITDEGMRRGPYLLLSVFLDGGGSETGRKRLHRRLGDSYRDAVESLIDEAHAFEEENPRSVHGFLIHAEKLSRHIKRDVAGDEVTGVRVMTVHGAKGLESPIVYCADADYLKKDADYFRNEILFDAPTEAETLPILMKRAAHKIPSRLRALRDDCQERRLEEYQRLFYVASTRAEEHLIICGGKDSDAPTWHRMAASGMDGLAAGSDVTEHPAPWGGTIRRYEKGGPVVVEDEAKTNPSVSAPMPDWVNTVPPAEEARSVIFPSLIGATEGQSRGAVRAPMAISGDARRRGLLIHQLLEILPDHPEAERASIGDRIAQAAEGLDKEAQTQALDDAMRLMAEPTLASLFGPGSRAEVSIQGQMGGKSFSGQIDRLLMTEGVIVAAEYKTTRWVPQTEADIPDAHRQQIDAYLALLRKMKPGTPVRGVLVYTSAALSFDIR